jgi:hypothetical protein
MIDPKTNKQPQPKISASRNSSPGKVATTPDPVPSQDMIRARAYELYEKRGREPGQDKQDWLCAEQEVLKLKP